MLSKRVVRNTWGLITAIAALLWVTCPTLAQDEKKPVPPRDKPKASLKVGDQAPPLKIEKWLKGAPLKEFEKGKIYVVEFWATWCGPCIASMPHLSALQKEYKDKGVTFIGTNIWEARGDQQYTDETLKKVEAFVKDQADRMNYTVAYDGKAKEMDTAYMKAAGQNGIPTAFLIDKEGKIAWLGHPMWLDIPLADITAGKWDPKTGPEKIAKAEEALNEIGEQMATAPKKALAAWEEFEHTYPAVAHHMQDEKFQLLLAAGEYDQAYKVAGALVDQAIADKDSGALNDIAWRIVDPQGQLEKKDLDLALKAAVKADELAKHENAGILDTLARAYFLKKDLDKAIEAQTKAVELSKGPMKDALQKSLDEYKAAKAKP